MKTHLAKSETMLKFLITWLTLLFGVWGAPNVPNQAQVTPPPDFLRTELVRSAYNTWTLTTINAPFARCVVWTTRAAPLTVRTICNRRYSRKDVAETIEIWTNQRHNVGTLELTCAVKNGNTQDAGRAGGRHFKNKCVCSSSDGDVNGTQALSRWDDSDINNSDIVSDHGDREQGTFDEEDYRFTSCQYPEHLKQEIFDGLSGIRVLKITDLPIKRFDPAALEPLKNSLQYLRIENINVTESGLPNGLLCHMTKLSIVVIRNISVPFRQFPSNIFSCSNDNTSGTNNRNTSIQGLQNLIGVFFEGNSFTALPQRMLGFAGSKLVAFNLTANGITEIHPMAFEQFGNLTELNLAHNELTSLPINVFRRLKSLRYLNLASNKLEQITTFVFRPLVRMKHLDLSNNRMNLIDGSFGILPGLQLLFLNHNRINRLSNSLFRQANSILKLYLDHNEIEYFEEDAFSSLLFLRALELKNNRIHNATNIQASFHGKMEYLAYIGLAHNNITILLDNMFQTRPYVHSHEILDVSFNQISQIEENAFQGMNKLHLVSLNQNRLTEVRPGTFSGLRRLSLLWIDSNRLRNLPPDWLPDGIIWLSLMNNDIEAMPNVTKRYPMLQQLYLSHNKISHLDNNALRNYPFLRLLNVTNCKLQTLGESTFNRLRYLEGIDLSYNDLRLNFSIDYWGSGAPLLYVNISHNAINSAVDLFKHKIRFADHLDISYNPLSYFPNQAKEEPFRTTTIGIQVSTRNLYMRNCSLRGIHERAFDNMPNLLLLDLSSNLLTEFPPFEIKTQDNELYFVYLFNNPIRCSCIMQWLHQRPWYKLSHCTPALRRQLVPYNEVSKDEFLCKEDVNCLVNPDHCDCYTANATTRTVTYLDCSGKGLPSLPNHIPASAWHLQLRGNHFARLNFHNLPGRMATREIDLVSCKIRSLKDANFRKFPFLETLALNDNDLRYLSMNVFAGLYRLNKLELHHNKLLQIDSNFFRGILGIQVLSLHDNHMVTLDDNAMAVISELLYLEKLTLHNNPWECSCDNATFKQWLQELTEKIPHVHDITCNGTAVITMPDDDFQCYDSTVYLHRTEYHPEAIKATAAVAAIVAMVTVLLVSVYINRRLLEVLLFHRCGWRISKHEDDPTTVYDAYAIYTDNDTNMPRWIRTILMPKLEPTFRLFIADRDSIPGRVQTEEIMTTIKESKRSIFFLCQNALKDDLFLYAFQTAYNYITQDNTSHQIILVLMEDMVVKDVMKTDLDPQLLAFLKTKQYICTRDKRFWKKLFFYMPDPMTPAAKNESAQPPNHTHVPQFGRQNNRHAFTIDNIPPTVGQKFTYINNDGYLNY